jgi:hypothetical protein
MAMGKIILLNGPPSSGKDTAAKHIRQMLVNTTKIGPDGAYHMRIALDRMSMPIKRAFAGTMGLPIDADGNCQPWESKKEEIIPEFGISYRQWHIDFSEQFLKKYDETIFGTMLSMRIERRFTHGIANLIVVPDCGFKVEIDVIYANFDPKDILLVRCHRPGFTFQGDSRSYVRAPHGCAVFDPMNALLPEYLTQIEAGVRCWLETPERMPREE